MKKQFLFLILFVLAGIIPNEGIAQKRGIVKKKTLLLPFNRDLVEVEYEVIDGIAIMEGDIVLGKDKDLIDLKGVQLAVSAEGTKFRWKNGVIPYTISKDFSSDMKNEINEAIREVNSQTNLTLVSRNDHKDYVSFIPGEDCTSAIGKKGGKQVIRLSSGCRKGSIIHEICHAAGLWHEQSREDRNLHVEIIEKNIQKGKAHNFKQHVKDGVDIGKYDYGSIMHYPSRAFGCLECSNGETYCNPDDRPKDNSITCTSLITIKVKKSGVSIGQRSGLSNGDIAAINKIYTTKSNGNPIPGYQQIAKHAVPIGKYQSLVDKMVKAGYMISWADFYTVHGQVFVNPIFVPKDNVWLARHNLTADNFQKICNEYVKSKGFKLQHVDAYTHKDQIYYACILVKTSGPKQSWFYGFDEEDYQKKFDDLKAKGYKPVNISVVSLKGKRYHAGFFEKKEVSSWEARNMLNSDQYQKKFDENKKKNRKLVYLNAYYHKGRVYYSAIWNSSTEGSYVARHDMSSKNYQSEFDKWTGKNYKLEFITACQSTGLFHVFAGKWSK